MPHGDTIAAYDDHDDEYHEGVEDFWKKFPFTFMEMFVTSLPADNPAAEILNLGSGTGTDAQMLKSTFIRLETSRKIVCVDAATSMVQRTIRLRYETHQATFDQIGELFKGRLFAGIWAHGALVHIDREEAIEVLHQAKELLLPNGIVALGVIKPGHVKRGMIKHAHLPKPRFFQYYTSEELRNLVEVDCGGFVYAGEIEYTYAQETFINHIYKKQ